MRAITLSILFAVFCSQAGADPSRLAEAVKAAKGFRLSGNSPLIHNVTKTKNDIVPIFYRGGAAEKKSGEVSCHGQLAGNLSETQARRFFTTSDGRSIEHATWVPYRDGTTLPPIFFDAKLVIRAGTEFKLKNQVYDQRFESRQCLEGHWDNWYDGEPNRNYICDKYSDRVDNYSLSVSWYLNPVGHPEVEYNITCTLQTKSATEEILFTDFERAFGGEIEFTH